MTTNVAPLILTLCAVANVSIGVYVLCTNPRSSTHRAFFLYAMPIGVWAFAVALTHGAASPAVWHVQLAFAAGSLVPIAMLTFAERFHGGRTDTSIINSWLCAPVGVAFSILSWSPWLVSGVELQGSDIRPNYGPLHGPFASYILGCFALGIYVLYVTYRKATGLLRLQTKYLLIAMAVPIAPALITNVVVPLTLGISTHGKYGPLFSLIMVALIAHAIIRHRFMDIRVVIKQGAVYLAAFVAAGAILVLLLAGSNLVFPDGHWFTVLEILLALGVAVLFHPLKTRIQRAFDRYLYREPYDYQRVIRETSRALSNTIELPAILDCVGGVIRDILKPEWTAVYLVDEYGEEFERTWQTRAERQPPILPLTSSLADRSATAGTLIFRDELTTLDAGGDALAEMTRLDADVVAPLLEEGRLFGLIVAGPKRSGSPYFSDDADLLQTLAHQSAVAIRNAQTHQRVLQVNEELQKTLATIESGVVAVGARGRVNVFNKAAEQLTGRSAETLRGRGIEQLPPVLGRLIETTLADGESHSQIEIALPDSAGQMIPLMCTTSPLRGRQGALAGAVAVFTDLSRLKELERERRRAERLASLEAIASGMVHEVRNPLVAIKAFTQLLPSRFDDAEFRHNFTRVVGREINRMDDLLDRFRMLSAASRQPMEAVNIMVPLNDTLSLLQPQLEGRRVALRRVTHGASNPVLGNVSQLEQLFLNLCLNALEAMDSGGELTVRVADLSQGGGSSLLVEFSDTGCGIPDDMTEQIFNPFVTTKARGTGLGLAICRAIADAHKAILRARNHPDRPGCTFTVEFPVSSPKPAGVPA
jgi:PAS domain S-box-containing protein